MFHDLTKKGLHLPVSGEITNPHNFLLFAWEGYSRHGNGFNDIVQSFQTSEQALSKLTQSDAPAHLGMAQVVSLPSLGVVAQFERHPQTGRWLQVK